MNLYYNFLHNHRSFEISKLWRSATKLSKLRKLYFLLNIFCIIKLCFFPLDSYFCSKVNNQISSKNSKYETKVKKENVIKFQIALKVLRLTHFVQVSLLPKKSTSTFVFLKFPEAYIPSPVLDCQHFMCNTIGIFLQSMQKNL